MITDFGVNGAKSGRDSVVRLPVSQSVDVDGAFRTEETTHDSAHVSLSTILIMMVLLEEILEDVRVRLDCLHGQTQHTRGLQVTDLSKAIT